MKKLLFIGAGVAVVVFIIRNITLPVIGRSITAIPGLNAIYSIGNPPA